LSIIETVTKTEPVGFAQGSFRIFRRDALVYMAQIATGAVIARILGPGPMGIWIILQMIPTSAEPIGRLHLDSAACYYLNRGEHRLGETTFTLVVSSLVSSAILIALFLLFRDRLLSSLLAEAASVPSLVLLMLAVVPLRFLVLNYSYLLIAREDIDSYNRIAALAGLAPSLIGAVLVLFTDLGVAAMVWALLGGSTAALAYGARRVHRIEPMRPHVNFTRAGELLAFGLKLWIQQLIGYFNTYGSGVLALLYLPAAQIAFLRMGQDRAMLLNRIPSAVTTMLYPRIARLGDRVDEARELTANCFRIILWLLIPLGIVLAVVAKPLVLLLYGPAYEPVVISLVVLIPGVVVEAATALFAQHFTGRGRVGLVVMLSAVALAVQVGMLWIVLSRWGFAGAIVGTSLAYVITGVLRLIVFAWIEGVRPAVLLVPRLTDLTFVIRFGRERLTTAWGPVAGTPR
jgi:O-antigen/teichoic acid export membrane protein